MYIHNIKNMKNLAFFYLLALLGCNQNKDLTIKKCDRNAAILRAENEWLKQYGKNIYRRKPFTAELKNDSIWIVKGTLPEGYDGGVPYAEINSKTCEVLKISHGK